MGQGKGSGRAALLVGPLTTAFRPFWRLGWIQDTKILTLFTWDPTTLAACFWTDCQRQALGSDLAESFKKKIIVAY